MPLEKHTCLADFVITSSISSSLARGLKYDRVNFYPTDLVLPFKPDITKENFCNYIRSEQRIALIYTGLHNARLAGTLYERQSGALVPTTFRTSL